MTKLQAEIIIALAENRLSATEASKKLFMHRTAVSYHIKKIHATTGKDPMDFFDMCDLLPLARRVMEGEVIPTEQTWNALLEICRKSHGGRDA